MNEINPIGPEEEGEEEIEGEGKAPKKEGTSQAQDAAKFIAKTGGKLAKTSGKGAMAGEAGGAIVKGEAALAAETGGASVVIQVIAAIIIVIVIILLVVIIAFIISQLDGAGRTPKQEPNQNSQDDMSDRGKAIANAGGGVNSLVQAKGMAGDDSFNQAKDEINSASSNNPEFNKLSKELSLNLEVMQSKAGDDIYVANEANKIINLADKLKEKTNSCQETDANCQTINQNAAKIGEIMNEIKPYTFTKKETSLAGGEAIIKTKPGLEINPLDLQYIKDNKIDIRVLRLVNHLGEAGWDRLKISRLVDFDPNDDESNVENEDEASLSAHNSGQALDISIVGTYKCSKYWGLKDFRRPCYVYYQTGYRPQASTSYGGPNGDSFGEIFAALALGGAADILNSGDFNAENWPDFLMQAGRAALLEKVGLTPAIFEFPSSDSGLGAYALGESLGIDPNALIRMASASSDGEAWAKLGAAILAQSLGLPSGSFEGNNSDELLRSIAIAYLRKSLGIENTSETADFSPQALGSALIEKILLTRDPNAVKERLRLSENIFNKSLNLPPEITTNYLSDNSDYNKFTSEVGQNKLSQLNSTYQGAGAERALGVYAGSWPGVVNNDQNVLKRLGAAILSRYILMDEDSAYQNPDGFVEKIGAEGTVNIKTIKQADFAKLMKGDNPQNELKAVADNYLNSKSNDNLNFASRGALQKNNLTFSKNIFSPGILKTILSDATNSLLERSIYSYQADFGDYTMSGGDIERVRLGDLSSVSYKMAGGIFDEELGLPAGFSAALVENREAPQDILAKACIALLAQALGIDISRQVLNNSWHETGIIPNRLARIKIENLGLKENTFNGSINDVIAANGEKSVAAALGLNGEELSQARAGQADDYTKSKLFLSDAALGVPNGTMISFVLSTISADQVITSLAASLAQTIQKGGVAGLAIKLGLDANHQPSGDLLGAFLGRDIGTIVNFFSSLSDSSINQNLLTSNNFFSSLVSSPNANPKAIIANEGIRVLSRIINSSQEAQLAAVFISAYLSGSPISIPDLLRNSTGITNFEDAQTWLTGQAKSALSYYGLGQLTKAVNQAFGNVGLNYDEARLLLKGDPSERVLTGKKVGYAYLDLALYRLDQNVLYGTSRVLVEGTAKEREDLAINYLARKIEINGVPLSGETLKKVADYFKTGDFEGLTPEAFAAADLALGLPLGTSATIQNFIENNGEFGFDISNLSDWAASSFESWLQNETGFDIGAIINIEQSIANGQLTLTGDPEAMAINLLANWLIGEIGSKIDSALGIPGFTSGLIIGALTGNWAQLAFALVSSFFGVRCQDPVAVTRAHVRLSLGQALNAPETPSQIATLRIEDVNYYSGLRDDGGVNPRLKNTLYEKYGPVSLRVYKGMFTLPWTFDHIHVGY